MAKTAAAARSQAAVFFARKRSDTAATEAGEGDPAEADEGNASVSAAAETAEASAPDNVLQLPSLKAGARDGGAVVMNRVAQARPGPHAAPASGARAAAAQPPLLSEPDAQGGTPQGDPVTWGGRRPPTPGAGLVPALFDQSDQLTGTTGPRPAVRRPGDNNVLFRGISEELPPRAEAAVEEVLRDLNRELNPSGTRRNLPRKEIIARLAKKLDVDDATAQKVLDHWQKARKGARSSQS
jgi:hypothetical protein